MSEVLSPLEERALTIRHAAAQSALRYADSREALEILLGIVAPGRALLEASLAVAAGEIPAYEAEGQLDLFGVPA